ncbi:hypothetical protein BEP19_05050 [Ammoniphilus oxalaticus]|uniref:Primosomal protein DnaI n=1 Tax=Ammoniphilus oxalaticus TaxID=66863 RepID=A0A419SIL7_9BACL|nr:primosomal protein DnaI [Ammoniphilus oxalaticus]RKD23799.1 hypothetical protein BEP19_05050 [Ammoniphilus oxalaticus]
MQSINQALSELKFRKPAGMPSLEELQQRVMLDPLIEQFRAQYPEITDDTLERSLVKLDQAIQEEKNCAKCASLDTCPNLVQGHKAELTWSMSYIETVITPCSKWKHDQEQRGREQLIRSHYIPRDVMAATFQDFKQEPSRFRAFHALMDFCLAVEPGSKKKRMKGIYLYGPLGVGKSYLMAATARKLADRNISSLLVYTPDFFREIKESLQDNTLQQKVDTLKKVPVLCLDDIGAETLSPWARDEILGAILQYRISENLPTLFTSNYDYKMLEEHLSHSSRGGIEEMKAKRIMERIVHYSECFFVDGINRRESGGENTDEHR